MPHSPTLDIPAYDGDRMDRQHHGRYRLLPLPDGRPPAVPLHLLGTAERSPGAPIQRWGQHPGQPLADPPGQPDQSEPESWAEADPDRCAAARRLAVEAFTRWLVAGMTEVLRGRRPAGQLADHLAPFPYADLLRRARHIARTRRGPGPLVTESVHSQFVRTDAVEVAVRLRTGTGSVALAIRLEQAGASWVCTALDFGPQELPFMSSVTTPPERRSQPGVGRAPTSLNECVSSLRRDRDTS
jgi:hypothetical protein